MPVDLAIVLGILAIAIVLFVSERVRVDVVALLVLVSLGLSGVLTPEQAISGFSNPAVITVWAVFILSGGLSRTGVAGILGRQVLRLAGDSETRLVILIMVTAAAMSAFMNNVGVAALLLPVVMDIARRTGRAPSKLLIPLAFSSLLGGLMTLIGTPPNILVAAAAADRGLEPFDLFDFTPVGASVVVAGIAYMALIGRRLLPERDVRRELVGGETELGDVYGLKEGLFALDIPGDSPLAGMTLAESRVGSGLGLQVMAVERKGRLELAPDPTTALKPGDRVLVQGPATTLEDLGARAYLTLESERVELEELVSPGVGLAEATVPERSRLIGQTIRETDFRHRFHGCLVLSVWRDQAPLRTHLASAKLEVGDVLLVHGGLEELERLSDSADLSISPIFDPFIHELDDRLMACSIPSASPLCGKTLAETRLGDVFSLGVMGIIRGDQKRLIPHPDERLEAGDRLLVKGRPEDLRAAEGLHGLPVDPDAGPDDMSALESEHVGLGEIALSPRSSAVGKTLPELRFREKYGMNVLAVMREGSVRRDLRYLPLKFGDALLVHGPRSKLGIVGDEPDFIVISERVDEPLSDKAGMSALIMTAVVGSVIAGLAPIYIAAVAGAVAMVLTRCLSMDEAYRSIEWRAVFLIAGMLPLGLALQVTGAAELLTTGVVGTVGDLGARPVLIALYVLTALCAQVMPTSAAAILIAPIALNASVDLGLSPHALLMAVGIAASGSFMSPVAHPANVLIMGPGGYRFTDYTKVGLPLTLICLLVTALVLPLVWPLTP
ncbi:MAG: SLC13 family permease [Gemmatimonadetes bacterium]|nr:SLC13 family permease [Gemmatimonadota bacterium]